MSASSEKAKNAELFGEQRAALTAARILADLLDAKPRSTIDYHSKRYDDTWSICTLGEMRRMCGVLLRLQGEKADRVRKEKRR